jgi:hypothetical protein
MQKKYGPLLEKFGVKETPYQEELRAIQEAAMEGVNRAAEERDHLMETLGIHERMAQTDEED